MLTIVTPSPRRPGCAAQRPTRGDIRYARCGHPTRYGIRVSRLPAGVRPRRGRCPVAASGRDMAQMGVWACSTTEGVSAARPEEVFRFRRISNHITRVPIFQGKNIPRSSRCASVFFWPIRKIHQARHMDCPTRPRWGKTLTRTVRSTGLSAKGRRSINSGAVGQQRGGPAGARSYRGPRAPGPLVGAGRTIPGARKARILAAGVAQGNRIFPQVGAGRPVSRRATGIIAGAEPPGDR